MLNNGKGINNFKILTLEKTKLCLFNKNCKFCKLYFELLVICRKDINGNSIN